MVRFPRALPDRPLNPKERLQREAQDLRFQSQECRKKLKELEHGVAVVGGGFAGVMAAWELSQHGVKVTVYEARTEVGGRVRSNATFAEGRITEAGAELIGSFHTQWLALARRYGLGVISRMDSDLYHRAGLDVKLTLDHALSVPEFEQLSKAMEKRILRPIALLALGIRDPSRPWKQRTLLKMFDGMSVEDALPKFCPIAKRTKGNKDERLWKMIEFKLVNDEVSPLDEMNFLGLLCKVRAGQGRRFGAGLPPILMGYWDELEIFRCADGCQQLAKEMTTEISQKDGKIWPNTMVKGIDIAKEHVTLTWVPVRQGKPDSGSGQSEPFDFVIFAIPPSVWHRVTIVEHDTKIDPTVEIGQIGMAPAVKFFSDVKERFWIKMGAAPYGGSLKIGQVWEGTDNQILVPQRQDKRGIVLSVFAGPLLPGPRVPTEKEFKDELPKLYDGYPANAKTLFANWPAEDFIETGYVNPKIGQLLDIGEKLSKPFHDRLFFAGEHTQMDFFGYMEGALRSGERAAHTLMRKACGLPDGPAPKVAARSGRTPVAKAASPAPRPTPAREAIPFEREKGLAVNEYSSADDTGEAESPFLHQKLFADSAAEQFEPRAAALVAESPFADALEERPSGFDDEELNEGGALEELETADEMETERLWEEVEEEQQTPQIDQEEGQSLDDESALLRQDEVELESPEDIQEVEFEDEHEHWDEAEAADCPHCRQRAHREFEEPEFEFDLASSRRDFSLKGIADSDNLPDEIRTDILRDGKTDVSDLASRALWIRHAEMSGKPLERTGSKHAKLRAEWRLYAQQARALIWLKQVVEELDKTRGDLPRDFLFGWMAVESDGSVGVVTDRPERGYFQIDWKAGEAREQLGLSATQFKKLSTDRVFSIQKGIELAEKYRQWILKNYPSVPDKSELLWRLTKGRHAASGSLKGVLDRLVSQNTSITWAAVSPLMPGFMRRNVDATLDYAGKLKPFADLVGVATPAPAPGRTQPELYGESEAPEYEFDEDRGREEWEYEWEPEAEVEEQPVSEIAFETMPEDAEAEQPLEEFQIGSPAGLALLDHMHVPKAPDPAHPGTFKTGGLTLMKTADMNPGWIDANDNLVTDKTGAGLQRCLELSITSDFQGLLSRSGQTAPAASDRIHVALVDLTGNKLTKPDFAGWGSTLAIFGASVPKILPLYAAYQLRSDLRDLISRRSPKDGPELEKFAIDEWKAKGLTTKLPDLVFLFDARKWKPPDTLDFTAATRVTFANISKNCPPGKLIARVGFPYIGSVAWQSGLFHPTRGGLWLKVAFCNQGSWASPVKSPHALNASALSAATYFSLLAQGRLVNDPSSGEIKDALKHGCVTSLLPPLPVVASKCGIASGHVHDCAWIEDADVRYVIAVMSRLSTNAHTRLYTKLCKELDHLIRENNNPSRKLCI